MKNGFPDSIATWSGGGSSQDIFFGITPRSCTVIGVSSSTGGAQLSKVDPMPGTDALSLPSGAIVQAIEFIAGGVRVTGDANLSGWNYYAVALQ